jgi:D-alanyl-D-alanine carboxypeptidase (penicillin-binding protein 5/6)
MKKLLYIITAVVFMNTFNMNAFANETPSIPHAKAYVLIEAETGEILLSNNENERLPVSSLAKIMLLLIVAEELEAGNITLLDSVPVPAGVMDLKAPVIWLEPGDVMPLGDMVKAVIMSSSNDAAYALAEYIDGTEKFTARMNSRAAELGMKDTFFADCGGFNDETYSTAYDIALMTAAFFDVPRNDIFSVFFTTRLSAVREGTEREAQLVNTNRMARWYEGILGGKAGQSVTAGWCLVNCAKRGDMRLVAVVLGARSEDDRDTLCEYLLDTGFSDFDYEEPEIDLSEFSPLPVLRGVEKLVEVAPAETVRFIARRGEVENARFEFELLENITAPVEEGQVLGTYTVRLGDKVVFESPIIALHAVEELDFKKSLELLTESFFKL